MVTPVVVTITSDFICPWCFIGERQLSRALESVSTGIVASVRWRPFELNPGMPPEGMDRRAYRTRKFGSWERSQAMDTQVAEVGRRFGLDFHFDRMRVTPSTRAAHRLVWLAEGEGRASDVAPRLFRAYFCEGRDIGDRETLAELATEVGLDRGRVSAFLDGNEGKEEVGARLHAAVAEGVSGVPLFDVGGVSVAGAQGPEALLAAIREAAAGEGRMS
jgi:predicted DsbA family dithiol-disulfide isomerase